MKILNTKAIKGIKYGEFTDSRYFEISKSCCGWDVEVKWFGYHFRWYPGKRFHFLRKA